MPPFCKMYVTLELEFKSHCSISFIQVIQMKSIQETFVGVGDCSRYSVHHLERDVSMTSFYTVLYLASLLCSLKDAEMRQTESFPLRANDTGQERLTC